MDVDLVLLHGSVELREVHSGRRQEELLAGALTRHPNEGGRTGSS